MKKILKPFAFVLAVLLITSTVSAAEPTSTDDCPHINSAFIGTETSTDPFSSSQHCITITRKFYCLDCGRYFDILNFDFVDHSFSKDSLVEEYHAGHFHYYVYFGSCVCGETGITKDPPEPCPGPPCNIHH